MAQLTELKASCQWQHNAGVEAYANLGNVSAKDKKAALRLKQASIAAATEAT